jgi:GT2 family glycosyltransferase
MKEASNKIVSVIVVTCGVNDYFKSCLDSLKSQTHPEIETIVIDNSLKPNLGQEILNNYPFVKLYSSKSNLFYCDSLNQGINLSKGNFILCLNDDVILERRFIEEAMRGFSINSKVGMVSGKILRYDGKTIDSTALFLSRWRTARERGYGIKDIGQFAKGGYIFGVNGAVAFYRRAMLEQLKEGTDYFDPDFRFFYEDLDVAWRAQRFGWEGYYIPEAIAYHLRGATVRSGPGIDKPFARRYLNDSLHADLIKNRYLAIIKNEEQLDFLLHAPWIIAYDLVIWTYIIFFKPRQIKFFISNLKYLKGALRKRKYLKSR